MEVTLAGSAAPILAHLLGLSGAGQYGFPAESGPEGALDVVLTGDLTATGAAFDLNVSGGPGDDVLGLARPADIASGGPIRHALAGGAADNCYAPQEVAVTGCEQLEAIGHPLLGMIETTFGTALADLWRQ
ncbi:MAG TPA: hypothetical protein VMN39_06240 [Longimicrobiaceae bacterium]|nr:hypothetical protein [Longimicrobiaceae bacterium]